MTDVFIAYSNSDRAIAEKLARDLGKAGLTVWWDAQLVAGAEFRRAITEKLAASKAVIVIWTPSSILSNWVLDEADYAKSMGKLLPYRIKELDPRRIPLGFSMLHTPVLEIESVIQRLIQIEIVAQHRGERRQPPIKSSERIVESNPEADIPRPSDHARKLIAEKSSWVASALRAVGLRKQRQPRILFSYRRKDSIAMTGRMYDRLNSHFGKGSTFMDIDSVPLGADFREHLRKEIILCDIVLAVIGSGWVDERDIYEKRKLDNPLDPVRLELEVALQEEVAIVPVLIGEAQMPRPDQLPASLEPFAYRNAARVDEGRDFHPHMGRLIDGLEKSMNNTRSVH